MIKVITGRFDNLEYDVRGIAMSFYPGEDITFLREDVVQEKNVQNAAVCENNRQENDGDNSVNHVINLEKIFADASNATTKNELRKMLYKHLKEQTGRTLPWGILIGIRPTKLTRQFLENELESEDGALEASDEVPSELIVKAAKWMQDEYLVSPEKSVLASIIAARELQVLSERKAKVQKLNEPIKLEQDNAHPYSLYVGIPFCPSRCSYCSFASQPAAFWQDHMSEYVDALIKELEAVSEMANSDSDKEAGSDINEIRDRKHYTCNSIYIGGGTPTTLPDKEFERLMKKIRELFVENVANIDNDVAIDKNTVMQTVANREIEFTVEAGRPDTITKEKLDIMKRYGVNRISINPQSMNEKTLEAIGRNHKVSDIIDAFNMARDSGFDNINMDMILGLPGESADDVKKTLSEIKKLKPDSLTVHALAVKRAARLNLESEHAVMPGRGEAESKQMMDAAAFAACEMGLTPYYMYRQKNMAGNLENVGYAAPGKECYYNIAMMEETESIIACGAGTVSKRVTNPRPSESESNAVTKQTSSKGDNPTQPITRCDTHKDPKLYIEQIDEMIARKRRLFA